jgi:threonyl-tRNA synthetase
MKFKEQKNLKAKEHIDVMDNPEEKLPENDHRIIGQKLDLFSINESTGAGLPLFHPNGAMLWHIIENFIIKKLLKEGYQIVKTPHIYKAGVWNKSGHAAKFRENMFYTESGDQKFAIKPMNCPGHIYIYKHRSHSYRELPIRLAEIGTVYRDELSGTLNGLTRVRSFAQDDAHIFCKDDQIEEEVAKMLKLTAEMYKIFDLKLDHVELSTMPEKHLGDEKIWKVAEKKLEAALKKSKIKYKLNPGDGAFYGPKIDSHIKDVLGRTWQLGTIQLDFNLPERFKLFYIDENNKKIQVVMLHRTIIGAMERLIALVLERHNGALPVWLSPVQVRVINMNEELVEYAKNVEQKLQEQGFRVDSDYRSESVGKKVREASLMKIPRIIVIGEKEKEAGTLAVRPRGQKPEFGIKFDDFVKDLKKLEVSKK